MLYQVIHFEDIRLNILTCSKNIFELPPFTRYWKTGQQISLPTYYRNIVGAGAACPSGAPEFTPGF
jgi:hypothetical protein